MRASMGPPLRVYPPPSWKVEREHHIHTFMYYIFQPLVRTGMGPGQQVTYITGIYGSLKYCIHYVDVCQCDVSHPMTHCFHYVSYNESCATNLSVEDEVARGLLTLQVTHFPILRILTKKRREYTSYLHTSCYSTGFHIQNEPVNQACSQPLITAAFIVCRMILRLEQDHLLLLHAIRTCIPSSISHQWLSV